MDDLRDDATHKTPPDPDNDLDDNASETSTIAYGHASFEIMKHKVAALAARELQHDLAKIRVDRMRGGTNNRVIGLSLVRSRKARSCSPWIYNYIHSLSVHMKLRKPPSEYIVRMPRGEVEDEVSSQVAVLRAIAPRLHLRVPKAVAYNAGPENPLSVPYMIQERIPGRKACVMWLTFNVAQKVSFIRQFTKIVSEIVSIEAVPGEISTRNLYTKPGDPLYVDMMERQPMAPALPAIEQTGAAFMIAQIEKWRQFQRAAGFCFEEEWDSLARITKSFEKRGFLAFPTVLVHTDLREYNILKQVRNKSEVDITGVIDWDDALIAPAFLAYRAPFWLWMPEDTDYDEENLENMEPTTDIGRQLEAEFLKHASEDYKFHAFSPESMIVRRMFYYLQWGITNSYSLELALGIIKEWDQLHPEDGVSMPSEI